MGKLSKLIASVCVCWALLSGCSKGRESQSVKSESPAPVASTPDAVLSESAPGHGAGNITGKVRFSGAYTPAKVSVGKDQDVCGDAKVDATLIVGAQGELKNAVIQIIDVKQGKAPTKLAVLYKAKCEYSPHVVVLSTGGTVKITNSDGILHNVHSLSQINSPFNRAQPKYLKEVKETFAKAEIIALRCDVHGWMNGWVVVTDNPFFDVTQSDGAFKFDNVPVGKYTLDVWHETLGKATQAVEVKAGEVTNVTFEFQMKK